MAHKQQHASDTGFHTCTGRLHQAALQASIRAGLSHAGRRHRTAGSSAWQHSPLCASAIACNVEARTCVQATPLVSAAPAAKHWGPLWQLRWQARPSLAEGLVSTAADGRLTQWSLSRVRFLIKLSLLPLDECQMSVNAVAACSLSCRADSDMQQQNWVMLPRPARRRRHTSKCMQRHAALV